MAVRFYADVERIEGEPTPRDPATTHVDFSIPGHAAYGKRPAATERIENLLAVAYGGKWRVTSIRSKRLRG